ncbi:sulfatase-like hydrolase/transferase [Sabulilitoribacter arenilitoris]|uniref:Sulfatase-like hydrolase/transferase n=1 Tax=Wocania arenilitoris TaxID=2044858 RepID=A0AAE3EMZ5_9FLAO|nr:sulfatase-like hydrolase/transferase [Wocania arenilitoris]MCF7567049.1 sulfatase-like hydrolase/transferase [Wocania arenilitoris]
MKCIKVISLIVLAVFCFTFCTSKKTSKEVESSTLKPNIIVILADDLGYNDVGFNGSLEVPTPNLDKLAESGLRCTNAYVTHPYCGPSRAGLITGRYQRRFGVQANPHKNDTIEGLPLSELTIADLLKKQDYTTAVIGKWHLGKNRIFHPLKRGFDHFFGFVGGGHQYHLDELKDTPHWNSDADTEWFEDYTSWLELNGKPDPKYMGKEGYITDVLSDESVNFIKKNKENPFFLHLSYNAPHDPFQATEKYLKRVENVNFDTSFIKDKSQVDSYLKNRKIYAAMVNALDEGVGQILKTLEDEKLTENTLIVFLSDNGGDGRFNHRFVGDEYAVPAPENHTPMVASNLPLRGNKGDALEGGIRVPFLMSWPGVLPKGVDYNGIVSSLDILPTAVSVAGGNLPTDREYDGSNILPFLMQGQVVERSFHWYRFKALAYGSNLYGDWLEISSRKGDWKLYRRGKDASYHLFNLSEDIGEQNNLADQYPEKVEEMIRAYQEWIQTHKAPLYLDYPIKKHNVEELYFTHNEAIK